MKGQADPVQEEDDVAEDPDPVASVDGDVGPMNGKLHLLLFSISVVVGIDYPFLKSMFKSA